MLRVGNQTGRVRIPGLHTSAVGLREGTLPLNLSSLTHTWGDSDCPSGSWRFDKMTPVQPLAWAVWHKASAQSMPVCSVVMAALMRNYSARPELCHTLSHSLPTTVRGESTIILTLQVRNGLTEVKPLPRVTQLVSRAGLDPRQLVV